jgi:hypothetical protein
MPVFEVGVGFSRCRLPDRRRRTVWATPPSLGWRPASGSEVPQCRMAPARKLGEGGFGRCGWRLHPRPRRTGSKFCSSRSGCAVAPEVTLRLLRRPNRDDIIRIPD